MGLAQARPNDCVRTNETADPHVVSNKVIGFQRLTMPITIGFVILRI